MTIPNVVLGELIDPVTFGNAVVDAVNEHETEISDRLPLSGGTLTGDLQVEGDIDIIGASTSKISNYNTAGSERLSLFATTGASTGAAIRLYGDNDNTFSAGRVLFLTGGAERMRITPGGRVTVAGDLQVDGVIIGGGLFAIADGIDTADVLDRAETATMPVVDEGVATTDDEVESVTVNEVVTALLVKVRQLEERIEALEA